MWAVLTGRSTGSCFYLAGFSSLSLCLCNFGLHCAVYFYTFLPPEAALAVLARSNLLKSFFFGPWTDFSGTAQPIGVKLCMVVDICPGQWVSFLGALPYGVSKSSQFLGPLFREYLENGKSQRYVSIRAKNQLDETFLKMYNMGRWPPRGAHTEKFVTFFGPLWRMVIFNAKIFSLKRAF